MSRLARPRPDKNQALKTYLFTTSPDYDTESAKAQEGARWSCSKNTRAGNHALVYLTGKGITYEWRAISDSYPVAGKQWSYACQVKHIKTFEPPISLAELCAAISKDDWNAPHHNMRVRAASIIPSHVAAIVRALRPNFHPDAEQEFLLKVAASAKLSPSQRQARLFKAPKHPATAKVMTTVYLRNPDVVAEVLLRAKGRCESCGNLAPFVRAADGSPFLEVHHPVRLADGGEDTVENALALCPNCHRKAHYG